MRRKVFSLMMMLLLAVTGMVRAEVVTIGSGTTTSSYLPTYSFYNYSLTQQIYTASEIGTTGNLVSVAFYNGGSAKTRTIDLYLVSTSKASFSGATDWITVTAADKVYSGSVSFVAGDWTTINLDTPFEYTEGNLAVIVDDNTGSYSSGLSGRVFTATSMALRVYSDGTNYNPLAPTSYSGTVMDLKNQLQLQFVEPAIYMTPDPIDLGYRPNNAWMRPLEAELTAEGMNVQVTAIESSNDFFDIDVELPAQLNPESPIGMTISTNATTAGPVNAQLVVMAQNRQAFLYDMFATAYDPIANDVVETAGSPITFTNGTFTATVGTGLYDNYELPGQYPDGKDVVYMMETNEEKLLNVQIAGNDGKWAVYTEAQPMADNFYTGPAISEGGDDPFNVQIGEGTSTTGYFPFYTLYNYSIAESLFLASELEEAGVTTTPMASLSWYATNTTGYSQKGIKIWMANVSDEALTTTSHSVNNMTLVFDDNNEGMTPLVGWNEFVFNQNQFAWDGNSNILIFVQRNNGEWNSTISWQAGNVGFNAMAYKYQDSGAYDPTIGNTMSVSTNRPNTMFTSEGVDRNGKSWVIGDDLVLVPGTYFLVASSTSDEFTVTANLSNLPLPEVVSNPSPADLATDITSPLILGWTLGAYTTEYRVLFGTTYPPQNVLVDWTSELAQSYRVSGLYNNKNYFWRVDERNTSGTTTGPVWGFTTALNIPQNLAAANQKIYEGDALNLSWENVSDRSYRGYNVYQDGVKINTSLVTTNNYTVEGLTYNMIGYTFNVTAVYDEGESAFSNDLDAFVSGNGSISGHVYEQDGVTAIAGVTVHVEGVDEFLRPATYTFTTNASGAYQGELKAGLYMAYAEMNGYQNVMYGDLVEIDFDFNTPDIDFNMYENYVPVAEVIAEEISDDLVKVYWSQTIMSEVIEDFESGDFNTYPWVNNSTYPWAITTTNPYEGVYCMKSGNANQASTTSAIEITYEIPYDGLMSFFGKISSENNWDYGYFYIDGVEKASFTGAGSWVEKEYPITEGIHTFKWAYTKDGSVNSNDDCFYVDYISFFHHAEPTPPGMTIYDFEDSTMQGWTTIDADGDGYTWMVASSLMSTGYGHNGSNDCVLSQSYSNTVGVLYPDNYLVSPQVTLGGSFQFYACAQDASYAAEHFGVAVSTSGNASASDFTTIQEWTMTAKSVGAPTEFTRSGNRAQGSWYQYTVDLSAYAGQTGYVAIRHFNCSDMFYLDVDDIALNNGSKGMELTTVESVNMPSPKVNRFRAYNGGSNNRSFNHYNVYRAACNDPESAELIAQVNDTVYMDVAWANLEPGVYMWGVSRVYEGNRESNINWGKSVVIDPNAEVSPAAPVKVEATRAPWDLITTFNGTSAGQQAVATDGNYIYTASWQSTPTGGYTFYKYDLTGNFIEGFNIAGATGIRDLTTDGQYFYGTSGGANIFQLDLANKTLVSTINCSGLTSRHIAYDPVRDGFWSGNWSTLALYSRTGSVIQQGPAPTSAYGSAYYVDDNNQEHLYMFCQPNSDAKVYDFNITTNTMVDTPIFDFATTPGFNSAIAGGCFIGDYNGTTAFFGNVQQDPNLIGIYELDAEVVPPTPPTPPTPGGEGESEIVWSNCIDHNMYIPVMLHVTTNSGDDVEGAVATLVNVSEPELGLVYSETLDFDGIAIWESFRRGVYEVTIELDGFYTINDLVEIGDVDFLEYELEEIIGEIEDLYVSTTGWAIFGEVSGGGGSPVNPNAPTTLSTSFEGGLPEGWTVIDGNNDGWTWCATSAIPATWTYYSSLTLDWYRTGTDAMCSGSYINGVGALTPNEYLITPQVALVNGSQLSFWVAATDASYPADHFGVFVSNTGTDPGDFTSVQEWTLTAKREGMAGGYASRNGDGLRLGTWYNYTVDLSAYAGNAYIAFRHFNCNDQYIMCLDDVELGTGRYVQQYLVRLDGALDGTTTMPFFQHNVDNLIPGETYTTSVKAIYGTGESDWASFDWVYTPCDEFEGLQEDPTAAWEGDDVVLNWVLPESTGPVNPPTGNTTLSTSFEGGLPEGWTVIDGNNDGYTWCATSAIPATWTYYASLTLDWYHTGTDAMCSGSYINGVGALTPNEYLITPQVALVNGSQLSFWVAATDASYPADHFGVFVSNTGTDPGDFTSVQEWTLTAKREGMAGGYASRNGDGLRLGTWYNYTVDLSAYAGNAYIAFRHFNCNDQYIMCLDDVELTAPAKGERNMWDLMTYFSATTAYQYGVATDGQNIYTSAWSSSADNQFFKYDMDGNFIEGFNISGCGYIRDLTYDGTYFYGGANANTLYCIDLANKTLIGSTSTSATIRSCTYDPDFDGFWVGEWSNLKLIDRNGAVQVTAAAPSSCGGSAYFKDENGASHVFLFCQPNSDAKVYDYNVASNTISSSPIFDFAATPGFDGISGGAFSGQYNGKTAFFGDSQQSPNLIGIYELAEGSGPVPPQPGETTALGVEIFRDGEWIAEVAAPAQTFTDVDPGYQGTYTIRVVHDGYTEDWTYYAMSCEEEALWGAVACDAPENLVGDYYWSEESYGAIIGWTYGEEPVPPVPAQWYFYDNGNNEDAIGTGGGQFWWGVMFPAGSYAGGQVIKVAMYDYMAMTGTVTIYNDGSNAPSNAVGTANVTLTGSEDFVEFEFATPVNINPAKNVWVVFYNQSGATYPASVCANTGDANGRWVSLDGSTWEDLMSYSLPYTFMVRAYIGGAKGEVTMITTEPMVGEGGTLTTAGEGFGMAASAEMENALYRSDNPLYFNVYRDGVVIDMVPFDGEYEYMYYDEVGMGIYDYQVTAVYDNCESDFALTPTLTQDYVSVDVTSVDENRNVALYPNPTTDVVRIEANETINHITVVSVLGQVIYDADVNNAMLTLNLGKFDAGVYMVRINTESGVSVKRVTVVK